MSDKTSEQAGTQGPDSGPAQDHFGHRKVEAAARQALVNDVFDKVADRYDVMNDLMSGGLHHLWKDALIDWLAPPRSDRPYEVIDVAGGTGDIARKILNAGGTGTRVTICDINAAMIAEGRKRMGTNAGRLRHAVANAEELAFPDRSFDAYTIAFGIRNVTHIERALGEAYRVLKPGGRFMCLEFSKVQIPGLDTLYDAYSNAAIPAIGKAVTGDGAPYRYLVESIARFPSQNMFARMVRDAGFGRVDHRSLTGGVVAIHSGWRL